MLRLIGLSDYRLMYQYTDENISSNAIVCIFDEELRIWITGLCFYVFDVKTNAW